MTRHARRQRYSFILFASIVMAVILAFVLFLSTLSQRRVSIALQHEYETRVENAATQAGSNVQNEIYGLQDKLRLTAENPNIKNLSPSTCNSELERIYKDFGSQLGNIGRIGPDGKFYCTINKSLIGVRGDSLGAYIENIFKNPEHKTVMSQAIKPVGANEYLLAVHVPVRNIAGDFSGTLGGGISLGGLGKNVLNKTKPSENGFFSMIDNDGTILYHPENSIVGKSFFSNDVRAKYEDNQALAATVESAIKGNRSSIKYRAFGEERFAAYVPIEIFPGRTIVFAAVVPQSDIQRLSDELDINSSLIGVGIFMGFILLIIAVALTKYLDKRVFRPIEDMAEAANQIRSGNMDRTVPMSGGYEISTLGRVLNSMVERLRSYSADLEAEVETKTKELNKRYAESEKQNKALEETKLAVLNVLEDLNEEKARVEAEKAKDEAILSSIGDGVFAVDLNGKIILFNKACEELSCVKAKDALGKHYKKILNFRFEESDKENYTFIDEALSGMQSKMANHTVLIREDLTSIPVADSAAPIVDSKGTILGAIVVFRDVTKEHELEKAKDEFVAISSHQLRTPATAVKQFLGIMLEGYGGKITGEQRELLQSAFESNERQLAIVNDLLDVASLDSGRLQVEKTVTDVNEMLMSVIAEQEEVRKERKQKIRLEMPKKDITFKLDPRLMRMVFENLVSNASKYSFEGKTLTITLQEYKNGFSLKVSDQGVGISKENIPKLFGKFSRISNPLSSKVGGSGLGLYLTKQIVLLHGGTIDVNSDINKGTTFTVAIGK
jgi:PAS domain S-box-containing protein